MLGARVLLRGFLLQFTPLQQFWSMQQERATEFWN